MMRWLMCAVIVVVGSGQAAAIEIWLSASDKPSAPPANSGAVPIFRDFQSQGTGSMFVWARPDSGKTLDKWSLRLKSSNLSVLSFDASSVEVPYNLVDDLGDGNAANDIYRWEFTYGPAGSTSQVDLFGFNIGSMNPTRIGEGIGTPAGECNAEDKFCGLASDDKNSWLLAKINYSLSNVVGQTDLFFQIGSAGISHAGGFESTGTANVRFGDAEDIFLNGETERNMPSTNPDGFIEVHPALVQDGGGFDAADFDTDNDVDGNDFLIWQRGLGGGTKATGDATGDSIVDGVDVAAWQFQFGSVTPLLSALQNVIVPEPATGALAASVLFLAFARRRRAMGIRDQKNRGAH